MFMNHIDTLIFDMDGLLVDTESIYRDGWKYAFHKQGIQVSMDIINTWVGKSFHETGAYIMQICGSKKAYQTIRQEREEFIYKRLYNHTLLAKPYAKEVLKKAKAKGYKTGLATSSSKKRSIAILTALELLEYLDFPVYSDDIKKLKPHPDVYLETIKRANCRKDQALAIEDSITGAYAAHRAGLQTILIPDSNFNEQQKNLDTIILKGKNLLVVSHWLDIFD